MTVICKHCAQEHDEIQLLACFESQVKCWREERDALKTWGMGIEKRLIQSDLQVESLKKGQYVAAVEYLKAEAQKIPLGAGDPAKGFSSTYNALMFCARALEENCTEKRNCHILACSNTLITPDEIRRGACDDHFLKPGESI